MTRVLVTGATGTIGTAVCDALVARGDAAIALSRDPDRARAVLGEGVEVHGWYEPTSSPPPRAALEAADAIIHLLGEPLAQRWTAAAKQRIRDSRVLSTRMLVTALRELPDDVRPTVLVSQSATGYYGPSDTLELDEEARAGSDFVAGVVAAWEQEALAARDLLRVTVARTGVVITPTGGALAKMLPFFRAGIGGPVAGGRQFIPWIHIDDVVRGLLFCLDTPKAVGVVNLTAPNPVDNAEFSKALGAALHRPAVLPVPALALKLLYGSMSEVVTTGQRVVPKRLTELGFEFRQPLVEPALRSALGH